jgi:hypothetical protein
MNVKRARYSRRKRIKSHPILREDCPEMTSASVSAAFAEPQTQAPLPGARQIDRQIRDFIAGQTDGAELLHALYDHILEEPIPQRMRSLLQESAARREDD